MENKITEREIYTNIINGTVDNDILVEFATKKLAQLDHRNEKAKERAAAKREAGDVMTEHVYAMLTSDPQSREEILEALVAEGALDADMLTLGKVSYRLSALVSDGKAVKEEVSIPGGEGEKARRVMKYSLA